MGPTLVRIKIKNPEKPRLEKEEEFLVDSGAVYSVVPAKTLKSLGLSPQREQEFTLVDGTKVKRKIGHALFEFNGHQAPLPVVFGERGDSTLLGIVTLESMGIVLDPFKRKLKPMKFWLVLIDLSLVYESNTGSIELLSQITCPAGYWSELLSIFM